MGFSEIEKTEQKLAMNPAAIENGGSYEFIGNGSTKQAREWKQQTSKGHFPYGLSNKGKEKLNFNVKNVSLLLNVILTILIVISTTLLVRSAVSRVTLLSPSTPTECCPDGWIGYLPSPSTPAECCPDGWIGYQRKCYYFSDSDRNWDYSQNYCASFNASLVVIDSQEEMSFLKRYKGPADYWIGLQRMDDQEPWRWINGTIFNNWFEILGGGEFAYINHQAVASSSGQREEPWICSKPVHK